MSLGRLQTSGTANNGGVSGTSLSQPGSISGCGTSLYVQDVANFRALVWNTIPTSSGQSANMALGQSNLTSNTDYSSAISASTLSGNGGVHCDGSKLFVGDYTANRILAWDSLPTFSGQAADGVIGRALKIYCVTRPDLQSISRSSAMSRLKILHEVK